MSNVDTWIESLKNCRCIEEKDLRELCERVKDILIEEPNVVPVDAPVVICGDIHGQYHDLMELFKNGGEMPTSHYVFLGDYVDRGYYSLETFEYLMCLKLKYPDKIVLLRGNHESRQITGVYGFYDEITRKYGNGNAWNYCAEVFDCLNIAALVEGDIFCIHAGLSPDIKTVDQVNIIDRKVEIPNEGPFADIVWSDPEEIDAWAISARGAGWLFGNKVVKEFNELNGLKLIARSHQLVQEGYKFMFDNTLVNIWSAPNYCYRCGNLASIMIVDSTISLNNFKTFKAVSDVSKIQNYKNVVPYFL